MQSQLSRAIGVQHRRAIQSDHRLVRDGGSRLLAGAQIPTAIFSGSIDGFIGTGAAIVSFATLGRSAAINEFADNELESSGEALQSVFTGFIRLANPEFTPNGKRDPIVVGLLHRTWGEVATKALNGKSELAHQVLSWLVLLIHIPLTTAAHAVDGVVAFVAVVGSVVTFGQVDEINQLAHQELGFKKLPQDLYRTILLLIHPDAIFQS